MATAIQRRRGNTTQHANFTGLAGEITIDTDLNTIIVHDGSTAGGIRLAKYSEVQSASEGDISAVNTLAGSGLTGGVTSGQANLAIDYENLTGNLIPSANNTYSLGSFSSVWKDVFVGPGSLYVNGQKVLEDNAGTIVVSADSGQNLAMSTTGGGDIEFNAVGGGTVQMKSNMVMAIGTSISQAGGGSVSHTGNIDMNSNFINELSDPVAAQDAATKNYVDTDSSVVRVTGAQTIAGVKTFSDDAVFSGNITVSGTTVTVNSETISLADNIIDLNSNFTTGTPTENAGIRIQRGDSSAVLFRWNEADDVWQFTNDGASYVNLASDTDDLSEGASNLYFTDARARDAVSASGDLSYNSTTGVFSFTERTDSEVRGLISATDAGGDGSFSYDSGTGVFTYTGPSAAEVRAHFSGGTGIDYNSSTGVIALSDTDLISGVTAGNGLVGGGTTGNVTVNAVGGYGIDVNADNIEVSNSDIRGLFSASGDVSYNATTGAFSFTERTDSEVRGLFSATDAGGDGSFAYDSASGVFTYTGPSAAEVRAHFSGGTGVSIVDGAISIGQPVGTTDDVTFNNVTATGVFVGNGSGLSTLNASNISSGTLASARLPELVVGDFADAAIQTSAEGFADSDTVLMTAAAIDDLIVSKNYSTTTGTVTSVSGGDGLTGEVTSSGSLAVGAGSYIIVNANDVAVDATSANTAGKVVARDGSGNFSAGVITATATQARYADVAERYEADGIIEPGTVVCFGGDKEITVCATLAHHAVAGVISTDPAYLMNEAAGNNETHPPVALTGRVPCKVTGPVAKGDLMVSSSVAGHARADNNAAPGRIIGKAIGSSEGGEAVIEVLVTLM